MTNLRKVTSRVAAATVAAAWGIASVPLTSATSHADPAGHQVIYTISSPNNLTATVRYLNTEPPSQAAMDADSSKYLTSVQAPLSGSPVTYTTTLANPTQWATISASGILHWPDSGNGPASFHCEISVDGQVVATQDATTTVTCAPKPQ